MAFRILNWKPSFGLFGDDDFRVFISIFKSYFPIYKYKYAIILVLIGVSSSATATSAWLVRDVVNDFFVKKQGAYLIPLFLVIVAAFSAKGLSTYWQGLLSARIANDMVARTQRRKSPRFCASDIIFSRLRSTISPLQIRPRRWRRLYARVTRFRKFSRELRRWHCSSAELSS